MRGSSASRHRLWPASGSASISPTPSAATRMAPVTRCRFGPTSCSEPRAFGKLEHLSAPADWKKRTYAPSPTSNPSMAARSIRSSSRRAMRSPAASALFRSEQPDTIGRDAYGSRYALPIWADFMQRASRIRQARAFERPGGLEEEDLCAITYLKPVDGCPLYTEFFKEGDEVPGRLCALHPGSIKQRVTRTIQGWMAEMGRRARGIFR